MMLPGEAKTAKEIPAPFFYAGKKGGREIEDNPLIDRTVMDNRTVKLSRLNQNDIVRL